MSFDLRQRGDVVVRILAGVCAALAVLALVLLIVSFKMNTHALKLSLKGGSFGTKASPDATLWSPAVTMTYAQSANYPILDQFGYALPSGLAKGYKCIDAKGSKVAMRGSNLSEYYDGVNAPSWTDLLASMGYREEQRYTTSVKSADGYYTVYVVKK